jgi:hypothetical protein
MLVTTAPTTMCSHNPLQHGVGEDVEVVEGRATAPLQPQYDATGTMKLELSHLFIGGDWEEAICGRGWSPFSHHFYPFY